MNMLQKIIVSVQFLLSQDPSEGQTNNAVSANCDFTSGNPQIISKCKCANNKFLASNGRACLDRCKAGEQVSVQWTLQDTSNNPEYTIDADYKICTVESPELNNWVKKQFILDDTQTNNPLQVQNCDALETGATQGTDEFGSQIIIGVTEKHKDVCVCPPANPVLSRDKSSCGQNCELMEQHQVGDNDFANAEWCQVDSTSGSNIASKTQVKAEDCTGPNPFSMDPSNAATYNWCYCTDPTLLLYLNSTSGQAAIMGSCLTETECKAAQSTDMWSCTSSLESSTTSGEQVRLCATSNFSEFDTRLTCDKLV